MKIVCNKLDEFLEKKTSYMKKVQKAYLESNTSEEVLEWDKSFKKEQSDIHKVVNMIDVMEKKLHLLTKAEANRYYNQLNYYYLLTLGNEFDTYKR